MRGRKSLRNAIPVGLKNTIDFYHNDNTIQTPNVVRPVCQRESQNLCPLRRHEFPFA